MKEARITAINTTKTEPVQILPKKSLKFGSHPRFLFTKCIQTRLPAITEERFSHQL